MLSKILVSSAFFAFLGTTACSSNQNTSDSAVQRVELKTRSFSLDECGGTLEANLSSSEQVSVVLRNVKQCSNFTISANGEVREYKLQGNNGNRGGSYTIPKSMIDWDKTGDILIDINSNSDLHHDSVRLEFTLPSAPVVIYPSSPNNAVVVE